MNEVEHIATARSPQSVRTRFAAAASDRIWHALLAAVRKAYAKQAYPLGYSPGLDGLRGVMTIGVLLAHIRGPLAPGAILGMDIFFVMSGYFITALLLRDWTRHGHIRFGSFYARRFARILPPFAIMIAAYLAFCFFFLPDFRASVIDAAVAFGYAENLWRAGLLPWIPEVKTSYLGHAWSLAIEEQFYLVWPWLLALLLRIIGIGWRLFWVIAAIAAAIWVWRITATWQGMPYARLYNGTDMRADALMIGCGLAVWLRLVPLDSYPRLTRAILSAAWPLLIMFILMGMVIGMSEKEHFYYYAGSVLCGALPGAIMIVILTRPTRTVLHRVFEQRPLVFLGRIFYALYLWHYPVFEIMNWHYGLRAGTRALIGLPLVFLLAVLSYALVERHFMRTAKKAPAQPVTATA
jgi:peptidoglycan/LPS O-acetylase OafA/YrhL